METARSVGRFFVCAFHWHHPCINCTIVAVYLAISDTTSHRTLSAPCTSMDRSTTLDQTSVIKSCTQVGTTIQRESTPTGSFTCLPIARRLSCCLSDYKTCATNASSLLVIFGSFVIQLANSSAHPYGPHYTFRVLVYLGTTLVQS